jgi:hypothetical protein
MEPSRQYQRTLLARLAFGADELVHDVNCPRLSQYDALDHLFFLANSRAQEWAAKLLVNPDGPYIDGELAEVYPGEYLLPTLDQSSDPMSLVGSGGSLAKTATWLCGWAHANDERRRLMRSARHLESAHATALGKQLRRCAMASSWK